MKGAFPFPREADGADDGGKGARCLLLLQSACAEGKIRVFQKYSLSGSWFFFSFVVMRQENQILLLSREGLHCPRCLVNFPWRLRMLVPSLTDQDFVPFFMALPPHAVSLASFTQSCLDSGSPKMQKTRSCRTFRKHGFSFVISFHIFLVACNEEIALIREPSYCFLSVKRGNSGPRLW